MATTEGATWADIEEDLREYARRTCSAAAGKARDDLTREAESAIKDFYDSYRPKNGEPLYYVRHYKNFEEKSFRKFYMNKHSTIFYGGVELTPQLMTLYYKDSIEQVFDTVYAGFHGVAGMFETPKTFHMIPPRMKPSPRDRLLTLREYIKNHTDEYEDYGKSVAKKASYKVLQVR